MRLSNPLRRHSSNDSKLLSRVDPVSHRPITSLSLANILSNNAMYDPGKSSTSSSAVMTTSVSDYQSYPIPNADIQCISSPVSPSRDPAGLLPGLNCRSTNSTACNKAFSRTLSTILASKSIDPHLRDNFNKKRKHSPTNCSGSALMKILLDSRSDVQQTFSRQQALTNDNREFLPRSYSHPVAGEHDSELSRKASRIADASTWRNKQASAVPPQLAKKSVYTTQRTVSNLLIEIGQFLQRECPWLLRCFLHGSTNLSSEEEDRMAAISRVWPYILVLLMMENKFFFMVPNFQNLPSSAATTAVDAATGNVGEPVNDSARDMQQFVQDFKQLIDMAEDLRLSKETYDLLKRMILANYLYPQYYGNSFFDIAICVSTLFHNDPKYLAVLMTIPFQISRLPAVSIRRFFCSHHGLVEFAVEKFIFSNGNPDNPIPVQLID